MEKEKIEAVMNAAAELSFKDWLKVADSITKAFEEKEHKFRSDLKLSNTDRMKFYFNMFNN